MPLCNPLISTVGRNSNPNFPTMKPRSSLTLTLAFLLFHAASSLPPSPSPSSSRLPPKQTMSDPTGLHLLPPLPPPPAAEGYVHRSCPSDRIECAKQRRRRPPPHREAAAERTREFGRRMGLVFVGVALLLQVVFAGFLVYKRIQLREGFSVLPSTTTS